MEVIMSYFPPFPFSVVAEIARYEYLVAAVSQKMALSSDVLTGDIGWLSSEGQAMPERSQLSWLSDINEMVSM